MDADGCTPIIIKIIVIILFVALRAFFTVAQTSLDCFSSADIKLFKNSENKRERRIYEMVKNPFRLEMFFLVIRNLIVFPSICIFFELVYEPLKSVLPFGENVSILVDIVIICILMTFAISIFADGVPRRVMRFGKNAEKNALVFSRTIRFCMVIFSPFTLVVSFFVKYISAIFGIPVKTETELVTEEDILDMVDAGNKVGSIEEDQAEMINNIFEFGDLHVEDVMTHRTDIVAVDEKASIGELAYLAKVSGFSRIPVYKETIDHISGMVCVKDLLELVGKNDAESYNVTQFMRETIYVPQSYLCDDLFRRMTTKHLQFAVIVDEYGGTAGIVTMEDLIETIVGNIQDEFDNETEMIIKIDKNVYSVDGMASPEEVFEAIDVEYEKNDEIDTLSGLLISLLGHIPTENETASVEFGNLTLMALLTEDMCITRIKITIH